MATTSDASADMQVAHPSRPATHCELLSDAVNDERSVEKVGCRVAASIEEAFVAAGWPADTFFASEADLCERYGVSRRIFREAVRVLTMRGTARVRRGSDAGLIVAKPDPAILQDHLRGYSFLIGLTEQHRQQALLFLSLVRGRLPGTADGQPILDMLEQLVSTSIAPGLPPLGVAKEKFRKTRAGQIAIRILDSLWAGGFSPGQRIGSEQQLSQQYSADRSITRQAIRLLESSGLISSLPGRGNGLFTMRPPSGPLCRLLGCTFAAQKVSVAAAFQVFEAMNVEMVEFLASAMPPEEIQRMRATLPDLEPDFALHLKDIMAAENALLAGLNNPLIDLLFRSIRGYVAPTIALEDDLVPDEIAACFAEHTFALLDALSCRDGAAAIAIQQKKLARIRELERLHHPEVAGRLGAERNAGKDTMTSGEDLPVAGRTTQRAKTPAPRKANLQPQAASVKASPKMKHATA